MRSLTSRASIIALSACALGGCFGNSSSPSNPADASVEDAGGDDASGSDGATPSEDASSSGGEGGVDATSDAPGIGTVPDASSAAWHAGPVLPVARIHSVAAAPGNGYLYVADGYTDAAVCNSGTSDGRVFYAKQNVDGSLGPWAETAVGPSGFARSIPGHAEANGFIYVAGGAIDAPSWDGSIWFAKPAADGTIPTWTKATSTVSPWIGSAPVMTISGGVLYVGAGFNTFASPQDSSSLFMATLDGATGQPGAFTQLGNLPATPSQAQIVISAAGYIYFLQGTNTNVYVAKLADVIAPGDGGADAGSPWTLSPTALPGSTPAIPLIWIDGTNLYYSPGGSPTLYVSALQADGSIGAWSTYSTAPAVVSAGYQGVVASGFFYVFGDNDCNAPTNLATATYYVPIP